MIPASAAMPVATEPGAADAARIMSLDVRDFRNLTRVQLTPAPEGFVLVGENGQGKTNLLEAIAYFEILRSVRGARDVDVVRFGADTFHLSAGIETDTRHEVGIGFERSTRRKRLHLDGDVPERLSDGLGALPSVMFSPADVELVAGAPAARRRFLDIVLALTARGYLAALQRYRAALARRNAALRAAARVTRPDANAIAVWEPPLAEQGALLVRERRAWVAHVAHELDALCREIGEAGRVEIRYACTLSPEADDAGLRDELLVALAEKRPADVRRGLTHAGPHRDDLLITLDGRELRTFGSAGQQRTAAIALRILEARTFSERTGRMPVLLFDDPFAELDERRARRILGLLAGMRAGQRILAVPRDAEIPHAFTALDRMRIVAGAIDHE